MTEDWSKAIFREEAEELLAELETTLLELEQAADDANLVNRVFRALHTIKGSGAMFGFDEIAEFTHEVESMFDRVRDGKLRVTRPLLDVSFKSRDHIRNLLQDSLSDEAKEATFAALQAELSEAATASLVTAAPLPPLGDEPSSNVPPNASPAKGVASGSGVDDGLVLLDCSGGEEPGQHCCYHIVITPRAGNLPEGYPLEPLFTELERMGEVEVVRFQEESGKDRWEVDVLSSHPEDDIRDVFFFADVDLDVTISCLDAPAPDVDTDADGPGQALTAEPDSAPARPSTAPVPGDISLPDFVPEQIAEQVPEQESESISEQMPAPERPSCRGAGVPSAPEPASSPAENVSSLRVAASKLDKLVDLVGELVIIQSQLSQHAQNQSDLPLINLSEGLDRLVEELRDTTLGARMIPIGTTFSKFRRLVRDLSSDLRKDVDFLPLGEDTELDKTVIERLADPIVHLLRNSMDHGIESPDERVLAGKSRTGTIVLSAEHSGGEVLIRMRDDGRGIDSEIIRAKAQEKGLIEAGTDPSERELQQLLFMPGFSTSDTITSISGRGVGMDVVAEAIDALRGTIEIRSAVGEGTVITIRLPLTLAIIDGLQVVTGDEHYVIPLHQVQECVELAHEERREQDGSRILDLRGEVVPYVNLREWFEVPGIRPAIEQVVITLVGKKRIGVVVDDVVGEHQTVIKSLGRVYRDVEGISGATVRGDGSIALILDLPGLVRSVSG